MTSDAYWRGTWLCVSMIARPEARSQWAALVQRWSDAGLLTEGEALLLAMEPKQVTYASALDPEYLPTLTLGQASPDTLSILQTHAVSQLLLRRGDASSCAEVRIDQQVNPDESTTLSLSVPLALFEADSTSGRTTLRQFLEAARSVFWSDYFIAGTVAEEARLGSLRALRQDIERWSGRAFYGRELAVLAGAGPRPLERDEPDEWLELEDHGLYVSWARWPQWAPCASWWRERLADSLTVLGM